jgi:hypothetical protein
MKAESQAKYRKKKYDNVSQIASQWRTFLISYVFCNLNKAHIT